MWWGMLPTENSCSAGALCKGGKAQVHVMGIGEVKPVLSLSSCPGCYRGKLPAAGPSGCAQVRADVCAQ